MDTDATDKTHSNFLPANRDQLTGETISWRCAECGAEGQLGKLKKQSCEGSTPELDKMRLVKDQSQAIGEFIDWLTSTRGVHLVESDGFPFHFQIETLLAEFFEIDLDKAEEEKRAILDVVRSADGGR